MSKWVFTIDELFDFVFYNFDNYFIHLKGALCQKHDGEYICGATLVSSDRPFDSNLREKLKLLYKNDIFLITEIDIKKEYIVFNLIKGLNN